MADCFKNHHPTNIIVQSGTLIYSPHLTQVGTPDILAAINSIFPGPLAGEI